MPSGILASGVQSIILNSLKINHKISYCCLITLYSTNSRPELVRALLDEGKLQPLNLPVRYWYTIHPAEKNEERHSSARHASCLIDASEDKAPFPTTLRAE